MCLEKELRQEEKKLIKLSLKLVDLIEKVDVCKEDISDTKSQASHLKNLLEIGV